MHNNTIRNLGMYVIYVIMTDACPSVWLCLGWILSLTLTPLLHLQCHLKVIRHCRADEHYTQTYCMDHHDTYMCVCKLRASGLWAVSNFHWASCSSQNTYTHSNSHGKPYIFQCYLRNSACNIHVCVCGSFIAFGRRPYPERVTLISLSLSLSLFFPPLYCFFPAAKIYHWLYGTAGCGYTSTDKPSLGPTLGAHLHWEGTFVLVIILMNVIRRQSHLSSEGNESTFKKVFKCHRGDGNGSRFPNTERCRCLHEQAGKGYWFLHQP